MTLRSLLLALALLGLASPLAFAADSPASAAKAFCNALNDGDKSEIQQFYSTLSLSHATDAQIHDLILRQELEISRGRTISGVNILHVYQYGYSAEAILNIRYSGGGASMFEFKFAREGDDWKLVF